MPLISADQTFALCAALLLMVTFSLWAERRPWGQKLGGPLLLLALSMAAANTGVIPHSAPLYGTVAGFLVPVAIPLLLMRADLKVIYSESGTMLAAFLVAAGATVAGAVVGVWLIDMGPLEAKIAGTITASYIGGSLNFVATAEAVGIRESSIYVAGLSADAVGAVLFLALLMLMPASRLVRNAMPSRFSFEKPSSGTNAASLETADPAPPFDLAKAATGLAVSVSICAVSFAVTSFAGIDSLFILVVTLLSVLAANLAKPALRYVSSEFELGTLFMYVFFACIGAGANLADVAGAAFPILLFIMVMVMVHLVMLTAVGKLMKLDLAEVMIASNACILGPAPAAALAAGRGWQPLVAPGILVGLFGYAIATFIGVSLAAVLG